MLSYNSPTRKHIREITRSRVPETNKAIAKVLLSIAAVCIGTLAIFHLGILKSDNTLIYVVLLFLPTLFTVSAAWCLLRDGKGIVFQYVFMLMLFIFWFGLELMSGYKTKLLLPLLIILSMRYYNSAFTGFTYLLCTAGLIASNVCNAYLYAETGFIDLNTVSFAENRTVTVQGFLYNNIIDLAPDSDRLFSVGLRLTVLPNFILLTVITLTVIGFMKYNLNILLKAEALAAREADRRAELADLQTKVMLSQVKPHFVYNALSSIAAYCTENPEKAQALTLDFSDYLRNNLDSLSENSGKYCSFETELNHIRSYLNIEKCRFEEKLNIVYDITATDFEVPTLCIQPIVENAVKHGVCKKKNGGTVTIATRETDDGYVITISDDGVGFDKAKALNDGRVHIGIQNTEKRLALFGGRFDIQSTEGVGTVATVFLPRKRGLK